MLKEIVAVYFENYAKHINALCTDLLNVEVGGTYTYRCALKDEGVLRLGKHLSFLYNFYFSLVLCLFVAETRRNLYSREYSRNDRL